MLDKNTEIIFNGNNFPVFFPAFVLMTFVSNKKTLLYIS